MCFEVNGPPSKGSLMSLSGLLACRFFLGLFEGGLLGGIILYLSMYSSKGER